MRTPRPPLSTPIDRGPVGADTSPTPAHLSGFQGDYLETSATSQPRPYHPFLAVNARGRTGIRQTWRDRHGRFASPDDTVTRLSPRHPTTTRNPYRTDVSRATFLFEECGESWMHASTIGRQLNAAGREARRLLDLARVQVRNRIQCLMADDTVFHRRDVKVVADPESMAIISARTSPASLGSSLMRSGIPRCLLPVLNPWTAVSASSRWCTAPSPTRCWPLSASHGT